MDFNNDNIYRDWTKLTPQTHSIGVNYSPLMVERQEEVLVKEERWPEATPAEIPPLIFLRRLIADPILCFSCFSTASFCERPGDPLYSWF
jgi:hypothetical protein